MVWPSEAKYSSGASLQKYAGPLRAAFMYCINTFLVKIFPLYILKLDSNLDLSVSHRLKYEATTLTTVGFFPDDLKWTVIFLTSSSISCPSSTASLNVSTTRTRRTSSESLRSQDYRHTSFSTLWGNWKTKDHLVFILTQWGSKVWTFEYRTFWFLVFKWSTI